MTALVNNGRGRVACGEDLVLEIAAFEILAEDRRQGSKRIVDRQFWLSPDQLDARHKREVYNKNGVPDAALFSGIFGRVYNPMAGQRPPSYPRRRIGPETFFDGRIPSLSPAPLGWVAPWCPARSAWWADHGYHGLDRYQRSRIRRAYWSAWGTHRLDVKAQLAEKYGVPPWVISRVAISSRTCKT